MFEKLKWQIKWDSMNIFWAREKNTYSKANRQAHTTHSTQQNNDCDVSNENYILRLAAHSHSVLDFCYERLCFYCSAEWVSIHLYFVNERQTNIYLTYFTLFLFYLPNPLHYNKKKKRRRYVIYALLIRLQRRQQVTHYHTNT